MKQTKYLPESSTWVTISCIQCDSVYPLGWEYITFDAGHWIRKAVEGTARSDVGKYTSVIDVQDHQLQGLCLECNTNNKKGLKV